jgi:hypothetical protein
MKKFKISLSRFDLGFIIAFVVLTLMGVGAWWYLSGALQDAQAACSSAKADFDKNASNPKYHVVVSPANLKILQTDIDQIHAQLDPLIKTKLLPKDNKLTTIDKEDPVAWKHDLDDEVQRLTATAKTRAVSLPPNFYFGFSRYLSQSPSDEQTPVLSKQLLGIDAIANILINAPVKGIKAIRRTYEEDPRANGGFPASSDEDNLEGYSVTAPGNAYTAYPFEVDFETTSENMRTVIDSLIQSPYIFVVRTLTITNSSPNSPKIDSLAALAGPPPNSVIDTSPGEVASTAPPVKGPQYLFGNSTLSVKARIDLIEWKGGN